MSDPEKSVMDKRLLGVWGNDKGKGICFVPFDSRAYLVVEVERDEEKKDKWRVKTGEGKPEFGLMKGFLTRDGDDTYLNIQILSPDFVYNPDQMDEKLLGELADSTEMLKGDSDSKKKMRERRAKISRSIIKETGIVPMYMVLKVEIDGKVLTTRSFDGDDDDAYWALDSADKVREYILKHSDKFKDPERYTFVMPELDDKKKKKNKPKDE